jgi:hypothetical protein
MRSTQSNKILFGAGLLGAITLAGVADPAAAQNSRVREERREVKEARKEVKQERKEMRKADTPAERRDARKDLKKEQRDLREEQRELQRARQRDNRPGYRPGTGYRPAPTYRPGYRPGTNNGWGSGYRPGGNVGVNFDGVVLNNSNTSDIFRVRGTNGRIYNVRYSRSGFRAGQRVRVVGYSQNGIIIATDINRI